MGDAQSNGRGGRNDVQPYRQRVMWIGTPSTASGLIGLWLCEMSKQLVLPSVLPGFPKKVKDWQFSAWRDWIDCAVSRGTAGDVVRELFEG